MLTIIRYLFAVLFSAISFLGVAQEVNFYPIITPSILAESSITDVVQDSEGYIWIGTYQGVYRYDGYDLKHYSITDSANNLIPNQYIRALFIDSKKQIFVLTSEFGIRKYSKEANRMEMVRLSSGELVVGKNEAVWDMVEESPDNYWLVGNFGMVQWNSIKNQLNRYTPFKDRKECYSIEKDQNGGLWVYGGVDAIAYRAKNSNEFMIQNIFKDYNLPLISNLGILFLDSSNRLWICNENIGVSTYDINSKSLMIHNLNDHFLKSNIVMHVMEAKDKSIWITSDGAGIYRYMRDGKWINYKNETDKQFSLPSNSIYTTFESNDGNIWVGTYNAGLVVYDPYKSGFLSIDASPMRKLKLYNKSVLSIAEFQNKIYLGTDGGGLEIWDKKNNRITHHSVVNGDFFTSVVKSLYLDNDKMYVGTYANGMGIYNVISNRLEKVYNVQNIYYTNTISGNHVWSLAKMNDTMIWMGKLSGGIEIFNPKNSTFKVNPFSKEIVSKLNAGIISDVVAISDTLLFVSSEASGLFKFVIKNKQLESYSISLINGLSYLNVQCISVDPYRPSILWLGTVDNGLLEYDWKLNKVIRNHLLQFDKDIFDIKSIEVSSDGILWLGTERGLIQYLPNQNQFVVYTKGDGMPSNRFNTNSSLRCKDGKMAFGTTDGLLVFDPSEFQIKTYKQKTVVTSIQTKQAITDDSTQVINYVVNDQVYLDYGKITLTIDFSALDYHAPTQVTYYYKLEGFDEQWNSTDAINRSASYYKLPPGTYTFLVRSKNREGIMDVDVTSIVIVVNRPWYMTYWFYTLIALGVVLLLYLFFQWRTFRIRSLNKKLQAEVAKQTAELVDVNNSLQSTVDELTQRNEEIEQNNEEISAKTELILKQQKELFSKYSLWEDVQEGSQVAADTPFENPHKGAIIYLLEENESDAEKFMYLLSDQYIFYRFIKVDDIKKALSERLPDLIILNPIREQNEGIQFLEFLVQTDLYSAIPRIFITSIDSEEIQKTAIKYNVEAILSKPLLINKVQHSILKSLEKVALAKQKVISQLTTPLTDIHNPENEWLNKLIDLITQHLSEPDLNAEFLCKEMAISKTLLYNKLKSISGQTVNELIRVIRLQKSTELLLQGKLTISEVAIETGFNSASYFSKSFTQFYGVSPKEFVRKNNS